MVDLEALTSGPLRDDADLPRILEADTVFEGKVFDVVRETVAFGTSTMLREYTTHHGAVAVLAVDDEDRVLLINQYRLPTRLREWEIPAGLLDQPGEDPLDAAKRELAEEVDLVAAEWSEPLLFHPSPGQSDESVTVYEARRLSATTTGYERTDEEAEIVPRWVSLDEAVAAVLDGRLTNALLAIAVLAAHARRR